MKQFEKLFFALIGLFAIVALFDHFPYPESFYGYSFALAAVFSFMYWYFKNDLSEALGLFFAFCIMLLFGVEDVLFFLMQKTIPAQLLNLDPHLVIGNLSHLMGYEHVTFTSLLVTAIIGTIIAYYVSNAMKEDF